MATISTYNANEQTADLLFGIIRPQSLDVKMRLQRLLAKDIDSLRQTKQKAEQEAEQEVRPYSLDELYGILKHDDGQSLDEMKNEYLQKKYGL